MNPNSIVKMVKEQMKEIKGMVMTPNGIGQPVMLWEGKKAWEDALKRLSVQGSATPLGWSDGLALTAQDVCFDQARLRTDGVKVWQRAGKYGSVSLPSGTQQSYGIETAKAAGLNLYIDDGLSTRPNSKVMLATDVNLVGIATCRHEATNARVVVAVYAKDFVMNAYGQRRVAAEAAYRAVKFGSNLKTDPKPKAGGRRLATSEFLRTLKAEQSAGVLPFVASTILALGSAAAMAL